MITPSFSLTATERVLPRLALDFTTASLDPRITFTRSGNTATVVNSSGLIAAINADLPRFDFSPVTLACNGLLIEESRTNSILYSNDLSQSPTWAVTTATLTPNAVVSPDGTQNAATISAAAQNPLAAQFYTIPLDAATYCISMYVKYVSGSKNFRLRCALTNGIAVATNIAFNAETGAFVSSSAGAVYTITNAGNGWFRVTLLATNNSTNTRLNFQIYSGNDATVTNSMAVYGCQSEVGSFATSYIPTVASQVTRTADVANMTGTNFSSWYNATQGAFFVESLSCAAINARFISVTQTTSGLTADNTIYVDGVGNIRGVVFSGSTAVAVMLSGARPALGTLTRNVIAYAVDNYAISLNGATPATDTSGALPLVANNQLEIGQIANGTTGTAINSHMRKIMYWPQRLINAEVQAFSK
jgi:hypothetical protein